MGWSYRDSLEDEEDGSSSLPRGCGSQPAVRGEDGFSRWKKNRYEKEAGLAVERGFPGCPLGVPEAARRPQGVHVISHGICSTVCCSWCDSVQGLSRPSNSVWLE